jgi:nicotinate-nucleotide pyrophosphorylase (carboxylating)
MFDNAKINDIKKFCELKNKKNCEFEVSWNIDIEKIKRIKDLKIDRISVGYITHSAKAVDFSLKIKSLVNG